MKSKLDSHRDYILKRTLGKPVPLKKLCEELGAMGCTISRSHLTHWLDALEREEGIKIPRLKRGHPSKDKSPVFRFLPNQSANGESMTVPLFLFGFSEKPEFIMRELRKAASNQLNLPPAETPIAQWGDLASLRRLSDTELCLLALLRSDLPAPSAANGRDELSEWYHDLADRACQLRDEIREACSDQKGAAVP